MIIHITDLDIEEAHADERRDWLVKDLVWTLEMRNPEDENEVLEKVIDIREISSFVIRKKTTPPAKNMVCTLDVHLKSGTIFTTPFRQGSRALEMWKAYIAIQQSSYEEMELVKDLFCGEYEKETDSNYETKEVQE